MKIVLILSILFISILNAQDRPKIGLVLSGGGARGGAHVGVLRVLEQKNVPIDLIVGTSIGSFVGGLYAAGKTPDEIAQMLISTNWEEYIRSEFNREDMPIRVKKYDYLYKGRMRVGLNSKNDISLPTGMLNRQPLLFKMLSQTQCVEHITDFDELPIPFRAIATDMQNGNEVVLSSGSLSESIYASSAIPGGLQPIEIEGITLIDGGVSNNIPISVARDMGADIIIAIDASEHFSDNLSVNSYFEVLGQLVDILMRKNADLSISNMKFEDILITPRLDGFTATDTEKYAQIIQKGDDATQEIYESRLRALSLSDEDYLLYKQKHRKKPKLDNRVIDEIVIYNVTNIDDESIRKKLSFVVGDELDENKIRKDLIHLYNMSVFDTIDYKLEKIYGKNVVAIIAKPAWNSNADMRFSITLEDDFEGHTSYSVNMGYTMKNLNLLGAEWRNDFEIGDRQRVYTEFFQPLDYMKRLYVKPSLEYKKFIGLIPVNNIDQEVKLERFGGTLALGAHISTDYEFEFGVSLDKEVNEAKLIDTTYVYKSRSTYVSVLKDNLDNYNFPSTGTKAQLKVTKELASSNSDFNFTQTFFEIEKPLSYKDNSLVAYMKYGTTLDAQNLVTASNGFYLGGIFNLSGYKQYDLRGSNMVFGALKYRYRIKNGGFLGSIAIPVYTGFTLESGTTWSGDDTLKADDMRIAGSIFIAADTLLGPFYLAYGHSQSDNQTVYLYLGEKF